MSHRTAVIGDVGGHLAQLAAALVDLDAGQRAHAR